MSSNTISGRTCSLCAQRFLCLSHILCSSRRSRCYLAGIDGWRSTSVADLTLLVEHTSWFLGCTYRHASHSGYFLCLYFLISSRAIGWTNSSQLWSLSVWRLKSNFPPFGIPTCDQSSVSPISLRLWRFILKRRRALRILWAMSNERPAVWAELVFPSRLRKHVMSRPSSRVGFGPDLFAILRNRSANITLIFSLWYFRRGFSIF